MFRIRFTALVWCLDIQGSSKHFCNNNLTVYPTALSISAIKFSPFLSPLLDNSLFYQKPVQLVHCL